LEIGEYTFEAFIEIAVFRLKEENVNEKTAAMIAGKVWNELGSKDIRDVVKLGRLVVSGQELSCVLKMMKRYYTKA